MTRTNSNCDHIGVGSMHFMSVENWPAIAHNKKEHCVTQNDQTLSATQSIKGLFIRWPKRWAIDKGAKSLRRNVYWRGRLLEANTGISSNRINNLSHIHRRRHTPRTRQHSSNLNLIDYVLVLGGWWNSNAQAKGVLERISAKRKQSINRKTVVRDIGPLSFSSEVGGEAMANFASHVFNWQMISFSFVTV